MVQNTKRVTRGIWLRTVPDDRVTEYMTGSIVIVHVDDLLCAFIYREGMAFQECGLGRVMKRHERRLDTVRAC